MRAMYVFVRSICYIVRLSRPNINEVLIRQKVSPSIEVKHINLINMKILY